MAETLIFSGSLGAATEPADEGGWAPLAVLPDFTYPGDHVVVYADCRGTPVLGWLYVDVYFAGFPQISEDASTESVLRFEVDGAALGGTYFAKYGDAWGLELGSTLASGDLGAPVWATTAFRVYFNESATYLDPDPAPEPPSGGKLTKDTKTTYTPGSPGVPGTPGSPYVPAYTTYATETYTIQETIYYVDPDMTGWTFAQVTAYFLSHPRYKTKTMTRVVAAVHPAQPAVAPTPGIPGTPAQLTHDFNVGWNSGAISQAAHGGDCDFFLTVDPSAVGVVAGLNSSNEGTGYKEIDHGLYFSRGVVTVYESGNANTAGFAFTASDVFTVRRADGVVTYLLNNELLHTSSASSAGTVFADASLYMGGDTITAAVFAAVGDQPDVSETTSGGGSASSFAALAGTASDKAAASSQGVLAPLTGMSGSGELAPAYAVSSASLAYMLGAAHGLTGEVGTSEGSFQPLQGVSADRPYASAANAFEPLYAFSTYLEPLTPGAHADVSVTLPTIRLTSAGHSSLGENAFTGTLPILRLSAYGGTNTKLKLPSLTLTAAATGTIWGKSSLVLPALTMGAGGTTGGVASAELVIQDIFRLTGYSGAVCAVTVGKFSISATGATGAVGRARLELPLFELQANGEAQNYGGAELLLPALQLGASAQASLVLPGLSMVAVGTAVVAAAYEAYSINLRHPPENQAPVDEVTRYTNFPFTQIVRYQGSYFGMAADGLYLLEGTTDDGAAIPFSLKTCMTDFGAPELKTVVSAYMGGRLGASETVTLHVGDTTPQAQSYQTPRGTGAQNHRQKFGKGNKARYYALGVSGDAEFALDTIDFEVATTKRRI